MAYDELDELQQLRARVDQMRGELDDAPAALRSLKRRGQLYKIERFPGIRRRLLHVGRIDSQDNIVERP